MVGLSTDLQDVLTYNNKGKEMFEMPMLATSLDCCQAAVPQGGNPCKKMEKKMFYNDDCICETTETERQRQYLTYQLKEIYWVLEADARVKFNMNPVQGPQNPKEYVEFIKEGKFEFPNYYLNKDGSWKENQNHPYFDDYSAGNFLIWVDPANPRDEAGYNAAYAKITKAKKDAERTIMVSTPAEGLAALKEFEATTFH